MELKAQREEMELASERKRQSVLRMEIEWAKRGCRARTTKQKARLERLEALKNGTAPIKDTTVELESIGTRMGKKTIELHNVSKGYGDKTLIKDFTYIVLKNQKHHQDLFLYQNWNYDHFSIRHIYQLPT